jgi:hypothetical protein
MKKYAGIGSRDIPQSEYKKLQDIAESLSQEGWMLRSGGAAGSDTAFASKAGDNKEIFRPKDQSPPLAYEIAAAHHPVWEQLNDYVKSLLARNAQIILGQNCDDPVDKVICWTPYGQIIDGKKIVTGGTGHSIRIAETYNIPVENHCDVLEKPE